MQKPVNKTYTSLTRKIYTLSWQNLKYNFANSLKIISICFIVPYILFNTFFDIRSLNAIKSIMHLESSNSNSYSNINLIFSDYLYNYIIGLLLIWLLGLTTLFSLSYLIATRSKNISVAIKEGFKLTLKKGLFLTIIIFFLLLLLQIVIIPALFITFLILLIPTVVIIENRGVFNSLKYVLTLEFLDLAKYSKWQLMMASFSMATGVYFIEFILLYLSSSLAQLDELFGVNLSWIYTQVSNTPYTLASLIGFIINLLSFLFFFLWTTNVSFSIYKLTILEKKPDVD